MVIDAIVIYFGSILANSGSINPHFGSIMINFGAIHEQRWYLAPNSQFIHNVHSKNLSLIYHFSMIYLSFKKCSTFLNNILIYSG